MCHDDSLPNDPGGADWKLGALRHRIPGSEGWEIQKESGTPNPVPTTPKTRTSKSGLSPRIRNRSVVEIVAVSWLPGREYAGLELTRQRWYRVVDAMGNSALVPHCHVYHRGHRPQGPSVEPRVLSVERGGGE